jgi:hypothetical protein
MAIYVTSLHGNARLAHIGYPITACGKSFIAAFQTSDNAPADRPICGLCVERATGYGWITADEADALLGREIVRQDVPDSIVALLIAGAADREIARRLGVSMRTVSRYVATAMHAAGARTRFQWGYFVARAGAGSV